MKYYLPLIILLIFVGIRTYFSCFGESVCELDKKNSFLESDTLLGRVIIKVRQESIRVARENLPSPHSELLLGMVIGVDNIDKVPSFEEALKESGTIHVVVVSGFNISLVFGLVISVLGSKYKLKNLLIGQIITLFYSFLSGFQPPIIRAWIMGSVAAWSKYYGRNLDGFRLLMSSGLIMVAINPAFLFSLSFQLSFMATLGLILYGGFFSNFLSKISKSVLFEDLGATLSAQVLVWPLISFNFGTVSIISPLVNMLTLWTVPIATILGTIFILLGFLSSILGKIFTLFIYPFLDVFVRLNVFCGDFSFASSGFSINLINLIFYYVFVCLGAYFISRSKGNKYETQ